jgi:DNA mismatch repair protein MutS
VISLLWPFERAGQPGSASAAWLLDLDVEPIVQAIDRKGQRAGFVRSVLAELCADHATIATRQDIVDDLVALPALSDALEATLPALGALAQPLPRWAGEAGVFRIAPRVGELELFVNTARALHAALDASLPSLRAGRLRELHGALAALLAGGEVRALADALPALRAQLDHARSVTLGINLDDALRPESATIVAVSPERFRGPRTLLGRLLSGAAPAAGLFPLRQASDGHAFSTGHQLFKDLEALLESVTQPVVAALQRFRAVQVQPLGALEPELIFLLGAARLVRELRAAGYTLTRPALAPAAERVALVTGAYSLPLLLRMRARGGDGEIVPSDVRMDDDTRVWTLSGPNRGGKTTYTRALGLAHVLAQAGLPVPGSAARISPVDRIVTLFPAAERASVGMGRLDEEAATLAAIFAEATGASLVLLNEPLTSTSPADARLIGRDVLCGLRALGCRALFVTHLHDLAREAEGLNSRVAGASGIGSLVASVVEGADGAQATFRIVPGRPEGQSYASAVAEQHGLSLAQIMQTLEQRGASAGSPLSVDGSETSA